MDTTEPQETAIKNIIFDLGGILVGFDQSRSIAAFGHIGASNVASYIETHRTEDLFLGIELGRISTAEFCDEARRLSHCAVTDDQIEAAWNALLTEIPPHKLRALDRLRERYRLFMLSNNNEMHWRRCEQLCREASGRDLESYFERCFLSHRMGMAKPSAEIFAEVLRQTGLNPAATLFIDDGKDNCLAAERAGFVVFHDPDGSRWETMLNRKISTE